MINKLPKNLKIIIIFFFILIFFLIFIKIKNDYSPEKIKQAKEMELYNLIDKTNLVNVTKYNIYGTHFNVEGTVDIVKLSGIKVSYIDLCLRNLDGTEIRH